MMGAPPAGGGIQIPGRAEATGLAVRMLCSTVDTNSASVREAFGIFSGFLREWVHWLLRSHLVLLFFFMCGSGRARRRPWQWHVFSWFYW